MAEMTTVSDLHSNPESQLWSLTYSEKCLMKRCKLTHYSVIELQELDPIIPKINEAR